MTSIARFTEDQLKEMAKAPWAYASSDLSAALVQAVKASEAAVTPLRGKTRDGRTVVIFTREAPGLRPIVGYVIGELGDGSQYCSVYQWCPDGKVYSRDPDGADLPPELLA